MSEPIKLYDRCWVKTRHRSETIIIGPLNFEGDEYGTALGFSWSELGVDFLNVDWDCWEILEVYPDLSTASHANPEM